MNLQNVHSRQLELMTKYYTIENSMGLLVSKASRALRCSRDSTIDEPINQEHIRLIVWRGIEELAEADRESKGSDEFRVELIDAFHFFTELNVFLGVNYVSPTTDDGFCEYMENPNIEIDWKEKRYWYLPRDTNDDNRGRSFRHAVGEIAVAYAAATYELKNKPWKQTLVKTDIDRLYLCVAIAYEKFLCLLTEWMTYEELMELYFNKSEINKNRQDTGY